MTFVFLHELWHVKQRAMFGQHSFRDSGTRRECQADYMAAYAYARFHLAAQPFDSPASLEKASAPIAELQKALPYLAQALTGSVGYGHLTPAQRVLAVRLAIQRALAEALDEASSVPAFFQNFHELMKPFSDAGDGDLPTWTWNLCGRVVRHDSDALAQLNWSSSSSKVEPDFPRSLGWYRFTTPVQNRSDRRIRVSMTALSGLFPVAAKADISQYTILGIATDSIELDPGEKGTLKGQLRFGGADGKATKAFVWTWPADENLLLSAEFIERKSSEESSSPPISEDFGKSVPACSTQWLSIAEPFSEAQAQLFDLARLGHEAADRFRSVLGPRINSLADVTMHQSKLLVSGAIATTISLERSGDASAGANLYVGASESEALRVYEMARDSFRQHCEPAVGGYSEGRDGDKLPHLFVTRLTDRSTALLAITKHTRGRGTLNEEVRFHVTWTVSGKIVPVSRPLVGKKITATSISSANFCEALRESTSHASVRFEAIMGDLELHGWDTAFQMPRMSNCFVGEDGVSRFYSCDVGSYEEETAARQAHRALVDEVRSCLASDPKEDGKPPRSWLVFRTSHRVSVVVDLKPPARRRSWDVSLMVYEPD